MVEKYFGTIIHSPEFFGVKRFCNICGFRFAKFACVGQIPREGLCPVCGSLERHRHLYIHLLPLSPFLRGCRVLHFAPEPLFKNFFINAGAEYYDVDIEKGRASYQVDMTNIPFEDMLFDYCIAVHVLEHIVDDAKALAELYRVLKPGGIAFLSVPVQKEIHEDYSIVSAEDRNKAFGQYDHVRFYSQKVFEERIIAAGFTVQRSEPSNFPKDLQEACNLGSTFALARK